MNSIYKTSPFERAGYYSAMAVILADTKDLRDNPVAVAAFTREMVALDKALTKMRENRFYSRALPSITNLEGDKDLARRLLGDKNFVASLVIRAAQSMLDAAKRRLAEVQS